MVLNTFCTALYDISRCRENYQDFPLTGMNCQIDTFLTKLDNGFFIGHKNEFSSHSKMPLSVKYSQTSFLAFSHTANVKLELFWFLGICHCQLYSSCHFSSGEGVQGKQPRGCKPGEARGKPAGECEMALGKYPRGSSLRHSSPGQASRRFLKGVAGGGQSGLT